jgi:DUF1680 family protein
MPILEDGSTFYYSDYHNPASKSYERIIPDAQYRWDKDDHWPCCSGTFPQLAADYGISAYMRCGDGVYVNLYVPSRLRWVQGGKRCALLQETDYPAGNNATLKLTAAAPAQFTVYLRMPAWAGKGTSVSVNGRPVRTELIKGFLPVRRTWRTGDRIELEIEQGVRQEPVDAQNPGQVAVMRGPQVMFAIADTQPVLSRRQLAGMRIERAGDGWAARTDTGEIKLRTFGAIKDQVYQTYWKVTA